MPPRRSFLSYVFFMRFYGLLPQKLIGILGIYELMGYVRRRDGTTIVAMTTKHWDTIDSLAERIKAYTEAHTLPSDRLAFRLVPTLDDLNCMIVAIPVDEHCYTDYALFQDISQASALMNPTYFSWMSPEALEYDSAYFQRKPPSME